MGYRAVIFDLDGTLLDTLADLGNAMNATLIAHGFPTHNADDYRRIIGGGMASFVEKAFPSTGWDRARIGEIVAHVRAEYATRWDEYTAPYPGIEEMLDALAARGIRMSVLSNKVDDFTKRIVASLLPRWRFDAVYGERAGIPVKPDPVSALEIARIMEVDPASCVFVGDSGIDMKTGRAAGMFPVGVAWGFRGEEELRASGAGRIIHAPGELVSMFDAD
ncbi:MAG TPA: HAD family hydrolase [Spirochaetota bacterium]|nr:HAD family hydrolase [Spirochaetota bacterium]HPI21618.1 HAD family hydrolase [Spirochaetota bacterium]HPU87797.1 HAD family hydrolase [Spirochaetota bacterium]